VLGIFAGLGFASVVVINFEYVQQFGEYGYLGAFLISVFGGATIMAPVPMTPVVFALGTVIKPEFAPIMGPILIGICAGAGETIGGLTIYWTGHSGGVALANVRNEKVRKVYQRALHWIDKRGTLTLFVLSAVINPFFYPAGLAAGATRYGLRRYVIICFLGKTVKGWTVALAGFWGLGSILRAFGVPV
jgi:membrane protein DedA with SNARE-associated domain